MKPKKPNINKLIEKTKVKVDKLESEIIGLQYKLKKELIK